MNKDNFASYNPWVIVLFYTTIILGTILLSSPITTVGSFLVAIVYAIYQKKEKVFKMAVFMIPMMLLGALINPIFNHRGTTILTYFRGNPITLEAVSFGIASAFMIGSIIFWFSTFNALMTSDKLMYLGNKIAPGITLVFAMVLRFVPRFERQIGEIVKGQQALGKVRDDRRFMDKMKLGTRIMSAMTTWSFENSVDLSDSMRARGFGNQNRVAFSIFKFQKRDLILLATILAELIFIVIAGMNIEALSLNIKFYPTLKIPEMKMGRVLFNILIVFGYLVPVVVNIYEDIKWKVLKSKI